MSKKFVYWYFSIAGITGSIIAITGISYLLYFNPAVNCPDSGQGICGIM
jgi:hypothetical protein